MAPLPRQPRKETAASVSCWPSREPRLPNYRGSRGPYTTSRFTSLAVRWGLRDMGALASAIMRPQIGVLRRYHRGGSRLARKPRHEPSLRGRQQADGLLRHRLIPAQGRQLHRLRQRRSPRFLHAAFSRPILSDSPSSASGSKNTSRRRCRGLDGRMEVLKPVSIGRISDDDRGTQST